MDDDSTYFNGILEPEKALLKFDGCDDAGKG